MSDRIVQRDGEVDRDRGGSKRAAATIRWFIAETWPHVITINYTFLLAEPYIYVPVLGAIMAMEEAALSILFLEWSPVFLLHPLDILSLDFLACPILTYFLPFDKIFV